MTSQLCRLLLIAVVTARGSRNGTTRLGTLINFTSLH